MTKLLFILILFASCEVSKPITGVVDKISGDTVFVGRYSFQVDSIPNVGDTVTFTPTVNRKKINSKRL